MAVSRSGHARKKNQARLEAAIHVTRTRALACSRSRTPLSAGRGDGDPTIHETPHSTLTALREPGSDLNLGTVPGPSQTASKGFLVETQRPMAYRPQHDVTPDRQTPNPVPATLPGPSVRPSVLPPVPSLALSPEVGFRLRLLLLRLPAPPVPVPVGVASRSAVRALSPGPGNVDVDEPLPPAVLRVLELVHREGVQELLRYEEGGPTLRHLWHGTGRGSKSHNHAEGKDGWRVFPAAPMRARTSTHACRMWSRYGHARWAGRCVCNHFFSPSVPIFEPPPPENTGQNACPRCPKAKSRTISLLLLGTP